ncbi:signal recognition particle [Prosthecomicrobium hirschii]|uniref:signal recognition particle n=1 Tax=Prosthecodimorpha hirschii TaxID=665126 RepID=UPI00112A8F21|nr:signal recognition particle [Prosthecomicrobium hirschii]TPQ53052.1 signal recognition particle [Prosthecomicrobium hirschii]
MSRGFVFVAPVLIAAAFVLAPADPAAADDPLEVAHGLGRVIAAETFCGLTYDRSAIEAFVEKRVPATAMGFISDLDTSIWAAQRDFAEAGPSTKAAICAHARRFAKAHGFVR